ncbi:MAG TPA: AraC family transcriptional regulator [Gammaproteobacteria bacterium]|nr:AraC family transcriptional regulator [Gammaproteobacteria bacterium]
MMTPVRFNGKTVEGISTRTTNVVEMNPETSRIAGLVKQFDREIVPDYRQGGRVYTVYYDYESDASGAFSVLIGTDRVAQTEATELERLTIPAGDYLVFTGSGDMPAVVIDTWKRIWAFFETPDIAFVRRYTTDFEYYKNKNELEIHIAVAEKAQESVGLDRLKR